MDTEKIHVGGCVHNVHSVHYLDKFNWLQLPNLGSSAPRAWRESPERPVSPRYET
jgi:hypothetical protein